VVYFLSCKLFVTTEDMHCIPWQFTWKLYGLYYSN